MKTFSRLFVPALFFLSFAHADTLKLRNGTVLEGRFISGDERCIWFQRVPGAMETYPLLYVEGLTFGAAAVPSSNHSPVSSTKPKANAAYKAPARVATINLREARWRPMALLAQR